MQELIDFLQLESKKNIFFLDYDGTLTEIVDDPQQAILSDIERKLLISLNSKKNLKVVIISGRPIEELQKITNQLPIDFLGNHGLFYLAHDSHEIIYTLNKDILNSWDQKLVEIKEYLETIVLPKFPNLWLQQNKHGLVLHTRLMDPFQKNIFIIEMHSLFKTKFQNIQYSNGKEIIEIKPSELIDKGKAIEWYLKNKNINFLDDKLQIFAIGDDKTDEDMFDKMNKLHNGIGIKISSLNQTKQSKDTSAKIIMNSVHQLYEFLELVDSKVT